MRTRDLSTQRFVNGLRSVLGKAPLYALPVEPDDRAIVSFSHSGERHFVPGRIVKKEKKAGFYRVKLEDGRELTVGDKRITLVAEL